MLLQGVGLYDLLAVNRKEPAMNYHHMTKAQRDMLTLESVWKTAYLKAEGRESEDVRVIGYPHDPKPAPIDGIHFPKFWAAESREHKTDLKASGQTQALFVVCSSCKRLLHFSVVGDVCYSCSRER